MSKPVLTKILELRTAKLGNVFKNLALADVMNGGLINWYNVGFYGVAVHEHQVKQVVFIYNREKTVVDISSEGITDDFEIDSAWSPKLAMFVLGSRQHNIYQFFAKQKLQKEIEVWTGSPTDLKTYAVQAATEVNATKTPTDATPRKSELMKATNEKRADAIKAAREKLAETKGEAAVKKRRISLKTAVTK